MPQQRTSRNKEVVDNLFNVSVNSSLESVERTKRKQAQLMCLLEGSKLSEQEYLPLRTLLTDFYDVFSLEEGDRHDKFTGDEACKRQVARWMPFAARKEVAEQSEENGGYTDIKEPLVVW